MTTLELIQPIVYQTYGSGPMVQALAQHLALKIDRYSPDSAVYEGRAAYECHSRERMIMLVCWDWFSGGDTARDVAHRIEESLQ